MAIIRGLDPSTVHRWKMPKDRGGTGGLVPADHQQPLLDYARANGLDLTAADFFAPAEPDPSTPCAGATQAV